MRISYKKYIGALAIVDAYKKQCQDDLLKVSSVNTNPYNKSQILFDLDISVRLYNLLRHNVAERNTTLFEISLIPYSKLSGIRGFGKAMFDELNEVLISAGLKPITP